MAFTIKRFRSADNQFRYVARSFSEAARQAWDERDFFRVGISGGNSPLKLFAWLSEQDCPGFNWARVEFFWVDERWVPVGSDQNNFGNAHRLWLSRLHAKLYPVDTSLPNPGDAVTAYDSLLREKFGPVSWPVFDWVLLGAGTDGHTASVFQVEKDQKNWVYKTVQPGTGQIRVSLTLPLLCHAAQTILLMNGEAKREMVRKIAERNAGELPVGSLVENGQNLILVTDIQ